MKRDMDLVRMILLRLENSPVGVAPRHLNIPTHTVAQLGYHTHIMSQEGLVEAPVPALVPSSGTDTPLNLTWKGHEFLELARDQTRWNNAKAVIGKLGGAPLDVWTEVLGDLLRKGVETTNANAC